MRYKFKFNNFILYMRVLSLMFSYVLRPKRHTRRHRQPNPSLGKRFIFLLRALCAVQSMYAAWKLIRLFLHKVCTICSTVSAYRTTKSVRL